MEKLLRLKQVLDVTGLGKSAIYDNIARGLFPAPVRIGERAVAWPQSKVQDWIARRPPANRQITLSRPGKATNPSIAMPVSVTTTRIRTRWIVTPG